MNRILFLFLTVFGFFHLSAQISTDPILPVASQKVTITFDSSKDTRLGYFTGDLYAHTGVIIEGNNDWQHVIGSWGNNSIQPKLTYKGNGIYEFHISPDIKTFYSVSASEKILKIAMVFRSADGKSQTHDIFTDVYPEGLVVDITQPANQTIFEINQVFSVSANVSQEASLKLMVNGTVISLASGTVISATHSFSQPGNSWIVAEAVSNGITVRDSLQVFVRDKVISEAKPSSYKKGINYPSSSSAALVLWAPKKEFVFVIGDFNNWNPSNSFQMKKDGDYFWLEIPNLEPGKEYAFQYFIDGKIKIADPYTEKILDPWNDGYISNTVYPNLIPYPVNKTTGIVSVLQPGQTQYNWEVTNFKAPDKEKLVIYELLIRDFTTEHTFKAVREKLDYLQDLRVNAIELMPVNEFEGNSSWGYNTSFYFAPDKYYGPKNELKKLIDECHKRGIAVIIDMVLNHSYGQSPFVQMYMDNWTITPDNPWYNVKSPNPVYYWGYDFNHEADAVKQLVDSVNSFWMNEYKIDGFRFDFTKGFTNTPGDGWAYDTPRVKILKRMADEIWARKPDALVILEHLADNNEELQLANYGMLLWGNMSYNYLQAARGNTSNSNLTWAVAQNRGWGKPNLVSYPESHDEERIMVGLKQSGFVSGNYNIKNEATALDRIKLNSVFHIPLPGPKMIWQFGERGYDVSINDFGGRLSEKPPRWEYLENMNRTGLFQVMAKLNELKQTWDEFTPDSYSGNLTSANKWYILSRNNQHVVVVGNFGIQQSTVSLSFPKTGKWFEFFTRDSVDITSAQQSIQLAAGEYRLYSTRKFNDPHVITQTSDIRVHSSDFNIYPNPVRSEINIQSKNTISGIRIYSVIGELLVQNQALNTTNFKVDARELKPGIYLMQIIGEDGIFARKFVVQ